MKTFRRNRRPPGQDGDLWAASHDRAVQMSEEVTRRTELGQVVPMWMQLLIYPAYQFELLKNTRNYGPQIADMFFSWKVMEADTAERYEKFCAMQREAGVPEESLVPHTVFMYNPEMDRVFH